MKILIINDTGHPDGGVETYIINIKNLLENDSNIVKIFSSDSNKKLPHFNDFSFKSINQKSIFRVIPYTLNPYSFFSLRKVIKEFKPDLIHINFIFYHTSPSILFLLKKIPTVMTIHAHEILSPLGIKSEKCKHTEFEYCNNCCGNLKYPFEKLKRLIFGKLAKNIDLFIIPSKYYLHLHRKKEYLKPIKCLYNGVTLFKNSDIPNENKLLFVGRLQLEKGIDYLIRAMPEILKHFPKTTLDIVGAGDKKEFLKRLVYTLDIGKNVNFIGSIRHNKLQSYYSNSCLVIMPSVSSESFGLVGVEAMSSGRPVIATRVGGIPEWLDDCKTGYLVEPGNSKQIAEKVIKLLSDRKLLEQMGKNARKKAEQFSIVKHVEKLEKVYSEVIKKYKNKN